VFSLLMKIYVSSDDKHYNPKKNTSLFQCIFM
jgi:hypothetical protein